MEILAVKIGRYVQHFLLKSTSGIPDNQGFNWMKNIEFDDQVRIQGNLVKRTRLM